MRLSSFSQVQAQTFHKQHQPQFGWEHITNGKKDPVQQLPFDQYKAAQELEPLFIALAQKHGLIQR